MSRNVVAIVSSILFVVVAALLVLVPVPFVTWRPGNTVNVFGTTDKGPLLEVNGIQNFSTDPSQLLMTTVSTTGVDSRVSLPEALLAHFRTRADALPREYVYPVGVSDDEVREEAVAAMDTSRSNATVAALRAAGLTVTEKPMVSTVTLSGPAKAKLEPGDLIEEVDGKKVTTPDEVLDIIGAREVGALAVFKVSRGKSTETVNVETVEEPQGTGVGITISRGFTYDFEVLYRIDSSVVGPSAGLVFSLAIYDKVTDGNLLGDEIVAGTGTMQPDGAVGAIGGVREKLAGAERDDATVFILPLDNCEDIGNLSTDMRLVPVSTLKDAINALALIDEGKSYAEVPTCG